MVIVKNLAKAPKGTFLNGMLIRGTKGRTMKKGIMKSRYGIELWKKGQNVFFSRSNLF